MNAAMTADQYPAVAQEPLFRSVTDALLFAFNFSREQGGESFLAKLIYQNLGSGKGLIGVDGAAQAGMILAAVGRLPPAYKAAITARFCNRYIDSDWCDKQFSESFKTSVNALSAYLLPSGKLSSGRLRTTLVVAHYTNNINFTSVGKEFQIERESVAKYFKDIRSRINNIEDLSANMLEAEMRCNGLIE